MKHKVIRVNIEVSASQPHLDPTLLKPGALIDARIVDPGLRLKQPPLITINESRLEYASGIGIVVDRKSLQVYDTEPPEDPAQSAVLPIMVRLLHLTASVYFNTAKSSFLVLVPADDPDRLLIERFVLPERRNVPFSMKSVSIRARYQVKDEDPMDVFLQSGAIHDTTTNEGTAGLLVQIEFHNALHDLHAQGVGGFLPKLYEQYASMAPDVVGRIVASGQDES